MGLSEQLSAVVKLDEKYLGPAALQKRNQVLDKHIATLKAMEDRNDHNGYVVYYAQKLSKAPKIAGAMKHIVGLSNFFGHTPYELIKLREVLMRWAKEAFSKRDFDAYNYVENEL